MKHFYLGVLLILSHFFVLGQETNFSYWVVNGNSWSDPNDFLSVGIYADGNYTKIDSIQSSSVQAITSSALGNSSESLVNFVAADTFLIKYVNEQRDTLVDNRGGKRLEYADEHLYVGYGYVMAAEDTSYFKIFNAEDLSLIKTFPEIDKDVADIYSDGEKIYVAVSGGWGSTTGEIAVVDVTTHELDTIIRLDTIGNGIKGFHLSEGYIHAICSGSSFIINLKTSDLSYTIDTISGSLGFGTKSYTSEGGRLISNQAFISLNGNTALYNFATDSIEDSAYIAHTFSGSINYQNSDDEVQQILGTFTDWFSYGRAVLYEDKDSIAGFEVEISPEGVAVNSQTANVGVEEIKTAQISFYPNPATTHINIESPFEQVAYIYNAVGQTQMVLNLFQGNNIINLKTLDSGLYFITLGNESRKLIIE